MGEELIAPHCTGADAQNAALLSVDVSKNVLKILLAAPDILCEGADKFARAGKPQGGLADEKGRAVIALQPLDVVGKRLLRDVKPVGSFRHVEIFRQLGEIVQANEIHCVFPRYVCRDSKNSLLDFCRKVL